MEKSGEYILFCLILCIFITFKIIYFFFISRLFLVVLVCVETRTRKFFWLIFNFCLDPDPKEAFKQKNFKLKKLNLLKTFKKFQSEIKNLKKHQKMWQSLSYYFICWHQVRRWILYNVHCTYSTVVQYSTLYSSTVVQYTVQ